MRMNYCDGQWLLAIFRLCFAEDTFFFNKYFISNFVNIVNALVVLALIATISVGCAIV
jgi:hypothetical protein